MIKPLEENLIVIKQAFELMSEPCVVNFNSAKHATFIRCNNQADKLTKLQQQTSHEHRNHFPQNKRC